jgi:hypothetical protein
VAVDLTSMFGELWCVTVTQQPVDEALRTLGVAEPADLPDGLARVTDRLISSAGFNEKRVLLLAREATPGWTLVLELEAATGWAGLQNDALAQLSAGGPACLVMRDPNQAQAYFAEDGEVRAGRDLDTGRSWGSSSPKLTAALAAAGFAPDGGLPENRSGGEQVTALVHAVTGVQLEEAMFRDPWTGGLTGSG